MSSRARAVEERKRVREVGSVREVLPGALYRVELAGGESVIAHVAESLRLTVVRVLPGDRVSVELGPRDTGRGRIISKISK